MSTVIIGGGGKAHEAITRLVVVYHRATVDQKAEIVDMLNRFVDDATAMADDVEQSNP